MKKMKRIILCCCVIFMLTAAYISSYFYAGSFTHRSPEYERENISALAAREDFAFSAEEYRLIFRQTGLGAEGVKALSSPIELNAYQDRFFAGTNSRTIFHTPFFCEEYVSTPDVIIAPVEDGDILVTSSSHVLTWRNGHAGIVTNAAEGETLEAVVIGKNSCFCNLEKWRHYPNFRLLRVRNASPEVRRKAAQNARAYMNDIPYNLLAGLYPMKYCNAEGLQNTQCAHLVWLAYASVGYDIDSNGGLIVTPADIEKSDRLDIVQTYG